jgi:hypothetical protein
MIAPARCKAFLSWLTAALNVIGLWLGAATSGYLASKCSNDQSLMSAVLLVSILAVNEVAINITPAKQYGLFTGIVVAGPTITLLLGTT